MSDAASTNADASAPRAGVTWDASPYSLFAHACVEVESPRNYQDTYSVVRQYGGATQRNDPLGDVAIQIRTVGPKAGPAMAQAQALFRALTAKRQPDDDGKTPVRDVTLDGFYLIAIDNLRPPALVGLDANKRAEVFVHFDALYRAT